MQSRADGLQQRVEYFAQQNESLQREFAASEQESHRLRQQYETLRKDFEELQSVRDAWKASSEVLQSVCQDWEKSVKYYERSTIWKVRTAILGMPVLANILRPIVRLAIGRSHTN